MPELSILVATWGDGLFHVTGESVRHELAGRSVRGLIADGRGAVLTIVDGHALHRRSGDGAWAELARSDVELSCCVRVGDTVFAGTEDARILRVDPGGAQEWLTGFDAVPGRERWYAGSAIVDGRRMGPPLGIRSMTVTSDGAVLLANVHVGGIPRSADAGASWRPTIDIDADVHQVRAHPARPDVVIAAAAAGLCVSRDAGATWTIERNGLHAHYCSAVAFGHDVLYVAASASHFAEHGAVYRRPIDGDGPLERLGGGMPAWTGGIVDTGCIATRGSTAAVIDQSGCLFTSHDDGATWASRSVRLPGASALHVI